MIIDDAAHDWFSPAAAEQTLLMACTDVGVGAVDAHLFRLGENAIFMLPSERIVARVARNDQRFDRVQRELAVARWLAKHGFPAVQVAEKITSQPVRVDGRLVTFWVMLDESGTASFEDLAGLLRGMHALPAPDLELPVFDPFSAVPARLANPGSADPEAVDFLRRLYEGLRPRYDELEFNLPLGVIHGDAHRGNVIPTEQGSMLTDFEVVAWGPREWDLTPTAMSMERFGLPRAAYEAFTETYGFDVTSWTGYPVLRSVRELTMVTWLMQIIDVSRQQSDEFYHRVASLRDGKRDARWHAY